MARKYILIVTPLKQRKIFIDDLKKIHKRRAKKTPALPKFEEAKSGDETKAES